MKKIVMLVCCLAIASFILANQVPAFSIENTRGRMIKSEDILKEGPLFLDFWATWCQPCLNSMPIWSEYSEKYPEMQFWAVSVDRPRDRKKAEQMIKSRRFKFNPGYDTSGDIAKLFGVTDVPRLFIISQEGEIVYEHRGYTAGDEVEVEEKIRQILGK